MARAGAYAGAAVGRRAGGGGPGCSYSLPPDSRGAGGGQGRLWKAVSICGGSQSVWEGHARKAAA